VFAESETSGRSFEIIVLHFLVFLLLVELGFTVRFPAQRPADSFFNYIPRRNPYLRQPTEAVQNGSSPKISIFASFLKY
jgi:hypothetical protein